MRASEVPGTALILFAHGARDPEWVEPIRRVRATLAARAPEVRVELAFLEFIAPNLRDCAESLVAGGIERILVLPMFIARGGHLKRDIPRLIEDLRARHPQVSFELAPAIGEVESVIQAMASYALALATR